MGCDIHLWLEVRVAGDSDWEFIRVPVYCYRSYRLFAYLSDVRNDGGVVPFGFPQEGSDRGAFLDAHGVSAVVRESLVDDSDFHSVTILQYRLLASALDRAQNDSEVEVNTELLSVWVEMLWMLLELGFADARLVVAYDN